MSDNGTNIEKKISDTEYITGKIVLYHSKLQFLYFCKTKAVILLTTSNRSKLLQSRPGQSYGDIFHKTTGATQQVIGVPLNSVSQTYASCQIIGSLSTKIIFYNILYVSQYLYIFFSTPTVDCTVMSMFCGIRAMSPPLPSHSKYFNIAKNSKIVIKKSPHSKIEHLQRKLECEIHLYFYLIGSNWNLICPLRRVHSRSLSKQSLSSSRIQKVNQYLKPLRIVNCK